jgi:DNA-binding winged helix-turn-helix (wHTH) protein
MVARFGCFEMDPQRRQLVAQGQLLHLTPKAFDLLWMLVEAAPRVVSKREIHERLWQGGVVADATLVGLVKEIRRAMYGKSDLAPLRTAHRIGYALDLPVVGLPAVTLTAEHWLIAGQRRIGLAPGENVIGRDPAASVWLDHATLSRRHARITLLKGEAILEDLGSKNGTKLRGVDVLQPTSLRSGDEFSCGQLLLRYVDTATALNTETLVHVPT